MISKSKLLTEVLCFCRTPTNVNDTWVFVFAFLLGSGFAKLCFRQKTVDGVAVAISLGNPIKRQALSNRVAFFHQNQNSGSSQNPEKHGVLAVKCSCSLQPDGRCKNYTLTRRILPEWHLVLSYLMSNPAGSPSKETDCAPPRAIVPLISRSLRSQESNR